MKKKLLLTTVLFLSLANFAACSSKPGNMTDQTYELGLKALDIIEEYDGAEISADEACEQLDIVYDRLSALDYENTYQSIENLVIMGDIQDVVSAISDSSGIEESVKTLKEDLSKEYIK